MSDYETFTVKIVIDQILPNPYQPREKEDPEHIRNLALDIQSRDLMQPPVGRLVDGDGNPAHPTDGKNHFVQLAFGHSRLAAYKYLFEQVDEENIEGQWYKMPMVLKSLSDVEMFQWAISENLQRRDLTPIEVARAMRRYRDEFGKTSAEIGELFGMSESTVRGKMRLVDLPAPAQTALASGEITEHAARRILTIKDSLSDQQVDQLTTALTTTKFDKPSQVDDFILNQIKESDFAKEMVTSWQTDKESCYESGMFRLDWQPPRDSGILPGKKEIAGMLASTEDETKLDREIELIFKDIVNGRVELIATNGKYPDRLKAAVTHLLNPPACRGCGYEIRVNNGVYCGRKACYNHKKAIWKMTQVQEVSQKIDIPIYDPDKDGKVFEAWDSIYNYGDNGKRSKLFEDWYKAKDPGLRVKEGSSRSYNGTFPKTGSYVVMIISVNANSIAYKQSNKDEKAAQAALEKERDESWARARVERAKVDDFIRTYAGPLFGKQFTVHLMPGPITLLHRAFCGGHPADLSGLDLTQFELGELGTQALDRLIDWQAKEKGIVEASKYLKGLAKECGIQLPDEWDARVASLAGVSVETVS